MNRMIFLLLFVSLATFGSCQDAGNHKAGIISQKSSVAEFEKQLSSRQGVQLLDVRTAEEYSEGHLRNAMNIDIQADSFAQAISKLDKKRPVMVYCRSGGRSGRAASMLEEQGFTEIYDLKGGITSWKSEGKPLD